ncbi:DUF6789 family protein [Sphingomonas sp. URHD0057]|uniref:DUF6789 family protein n=1 Tax=Sphingomonas sp. URHD0057 TaxID=1380389 RepID=UPI00048E013A|nr:DUF6789 family protein [Sphingomonas sp. URHD0057]
MNAAARSLLSGLAGGLAWIAAMLLLFGPAQSILGDPGLQSAKFMNVMADPEQPPRMAGALWIVPVGLMMIAQCHAAVFAWVGDRLPGRSALRRGLAFGLIAWALSFPWFEFYLPWNVMLEPLPLVALELACWLGVMLAVGAAISVTWAATARP